MVYQITASYHQKDDERTFARWLTSIDSVNHAEIHFSDESR
jgi:hypothetical protein